MSDPNLTDLRLLALDAEDLEILSAHLQDAVIRVGDMAYLPREHRFAAVLNRFDWVNAVADSSSAKPVNVRRNAAIRFERVLKAQLQGIDLKASKQALALLALQFEPGEAPAGAVTLIFAGGAAVRLEVECIEAELKDLGAAWAAKSRPAHPDDESGNG